MFYNMFFNVFLVAYFRKRILNSLLHSFFSLIKLVRINYVSKPSKSRRDSSLNYSRLVLAYSLNYITFALTLHQVTSHHTSTSIMNDLNQVPNEFWAGLFSLLTFVAGLLIDPKKKRKNGTRKPNY